MDVSLNLKRNFKNTRFLLLSFNKIFIKKYKSTQHTSTIISDAKQLCLPIYKEISSLEKCDYKNSEITT